jgi:hypothetical protein
VTHYPDSALIDRLVLGQPSSRELDRLLVRGVEAGETHLELAARYGLTPAAVAQRLVRVRARVARLAQGKRP